MRDRFPFRLLLCVVLSAVLTPAPGGPFALSAEGRRTADRYTEREQPSGDAREFRASDGARLRYFAFEPESPRAAIVLYHRGGEHAGRERYHALAEKLRDEHELAVYLADIRGHGRSGREPGVAPSINRPLHDLRDLYDELREETELPVYLAGHSHGAGLLTNYAVYPDRREPAGYIMIAPKLGPDSGVRRSDAPVATESRRGVFAAASLTAGLLGGRRTALVFVRPEQEFIDDPLLLRGVSRNLAEALVPRAPQAQFNRIARPTALIAAEDDEFLDPDRVLAYRNLLPSAVRPFAVTQRVADSDHTTIIPESADAIAAVIEEWGPVPAAAPNHRDEAHIAMPDDLARNPHAAYRATTLGLFLSSLAEAEASIHHQRARRLSTTSEPAMLENYMGLRVSAAVGPTHGELGLSAFARPVTALELEAGLRAATGWTLERAGEGLRTADETDAPLEDDPRGAVLLRPFARTEIALDTRRWGAGPWLGFVAGAGTELERTSLYDSDAEAYEYRETGRREPGWAQTLRASLAYEPPIILSNLAVELERQRDGVFDDGRSEPWFTTIRPVVSFTPSDRLELRAFFEFTDREIDGDTSERGRLDRPEVYRAGLTLFRRF